MELPEIYLLRHGVTVAHMQGVTAGTLETELTPLGHEQARAAGKFLRRIQLKKIFSNPQTRARQTTVSLELDVPIEYDDRIKEMCYGIFEGRDYKTCAEGGLTFTRIFADHSLRFPKSESYAEVEERARSFIEEKIKTESEPVVIVTHSAFGKIFLATLLPHLREKVGGFSLGYADVIC